MRFLVLVLLLAESVRAEEPKQENPLRVELVSSVTEFVPGEPFQVALHLRHKENHHSYWKAPGIVGIPTSVTWELPDGFTMGPLRWPVPERVDMAGHNAHGYRDDVLLVATLTSPPDFAKAKLKIKGRAGWMCCFKTCHPGSKDLTLSIKRGGEAVAAPEETAVLFEEAAALLPRPAEGWDVSARSKGDELVLELSSSTDGEALPAELYFFCEQTLVDSDQPQALQPRQGKLLLRLGRAQFGPKDSARISGLLFRPDGWGIHEGKVGCYLPIDVPLERSLK